MLPLCMRCPLMQGLCAGVRRVVFCVPGRIRLEFGYEHQQQRIRTDGCKRRECVHQQREQLQLQRHNGRHIWRQLVWRVDERCVHWRLYLEQRWSVSRIVTFPFRLVSLRANQRYRPCGLHQRLDVCQLCRCQSCVFTLPACVHLFALTRVCPAENTGSEGSNVRAFAIITPSIMPPLCMRCPLMQGLCAGVRRVVFCVPGRIRLKCQQ